METNKVFELVEYLYIERERIASYKKILEKKRRLNNEAYSLKPKSPLAEDTLYKQKLREYEEYVTKNKVDRFLDEHVNKLSELGFTFNGSYMQQIQNIITVWINNITDKVEARKQLTECKRKHDELQTEEVQFVLDCISVCFFDLNYILKEVFDKHLGKKYNDLSSDLKPYLERYDADVIESIIDYKRLPQGAEKPIWKRQADAHVFSKCFKIDMKEMNKMFLYRNGKGDVIEKLGYNTKSKSPEVSNVLSKYH